MVTAASERAPDTSQSLASRAYAIIKGKILARELRGGTTVVEDRLARELDLSRTPLREALRRLSGEGLLVKEGSRQFTIRRVTASEFFQSMRVRELLESEAAALAAGRLDRELADKVRAEIQRLSKLKQQSHEHWQLDDQIHELIADTSGNAVAARLIHNLRATTRLFEINRPFGRVGADASEHLAILDAVESGNRKVARQAMRQHIRQIQKEVMAALTGE